MERTREEFRRRVFAAYRKATGSEDEHGAGAWFQREAGIRHRNTVSRWLRDDDGYQTRDPSDLAWALLESVEEKLERTGRQA